MKQISKHYKLNSRLLEHDFEVSQEQDENYLSSKLIAEYYAKTENAITVLSNMADDISFICYGRLGERLGFGSGTEEVSSIWEKKILDHIHPDDMAEKIAWELQFLSFVRQLPRDERSNYYLLHFIRFKDRNGVLTTLRHRIFYLDFDAEGNVLLTLCLYTASKDQQCSAGIYNSLDDTKLKDARRHAQSIVTERECEILRWISRGMASKQIANELCISINTVNNHRQNILRKLQCQNTTEAIGVACRLGLLDRE